MYKRQSVTGTINNLQYKPGADANTPESKPSQEFEANGRLTSARYDSLLTSFPQAQEKGSNDLMMNVLIDLVSPIIVLLLLYYLLMRQFKMAGRGAMAFGKSRARMLTRDREKVTFKEVAGCDEAKEEVSEIVEFLKDPKKFQRIGGRVPKGVLMVGPPGCLLYTSRCV